MANIICWMCENGLSFKDYKDTEFLDENGNKPCFDCLTEAGAFDEQEEAEG